MKSLQDIYDAVGESEPRIAIRQGDLNLQDPNTAYRISTPGSYYLLGDLEVPTGLTALAISSTGDVTIDLNGFTIREVAGPGTRRVGIFDVNQSNPSGRVTVRNGRIAGFATGISLNSKEPVLIEDVMIEGVQTTGVFSDRRTIVRNVQVRSVGEHGFRLGSQSIVQNSIASATTRHGFLTGEGSIIENCIAVDVGEAGFSIGNNSVLRGATVTNAGTAVNTFPSIAGGTNVSIVGCTVRGGSSNGISVNSGTIENCSVTSVGGMGIQVLESGTVRGCVVVSPTSTGIRLARSGSIIDCSVSSVPASFHGVFVLGGGTVTGTNVESSEGIGFFVNNANLVNNTAYNCLTGFILNNGSTARQCSSRRSLGAAGTGFSIQNVGNRVEDCYAGGHTIGFLTNGNSHFVFRNTAVANGTNYSFGGSNILRGDIISTAGVINAANGWVNYALTP